MERLRPRAANALAGATRALSRSTNEAEQRVVLHSLSSSLQWKPGSHFKALHALRVPSVELHRRSDLEEGVWAKSPGVILPFLRVDDEYKLKALEELRAYGWPPHNNVGAVLAVPLFESSKRPGAMATSCVEAALELAQRAKAKDLRCRVSLLDAFGAESASEVGAAAVEVVAKLFADTGCETVVLDDRRNHLGALGDGAAERFERVVEAVLGADASGGTTGGRRLGVRLAGSVLGAQLSLRAAAAHGVGQIECCPFGEAAPRLAHVAAACAEAGVTVAGIDLEAISTSPEWS